MTQLEHIGEGIATVALPLRIPGLSIGTRMTVVRLPSGELLVHSPGPLDESLKTDVDALGRVGHVVAPNRYHHLYVRAWKEAYPDAVFHAAPGLAKKRKDFTFDHELGEEPHDAWRGALDQKVLDGAPMMGEVVFCHRDSGTLIACDLAMNIQEATGFATRMFWTVNGGWQRFGPTRMVRFTFKDKAKVRESVEHMLDWDFDRVLIAHGRSLDSGGKDALREVYSRV